MGSYEKSRQAIKFLTNFSGYYDVDLIGNDEGTINSVKKIDSYGGEI